MTLVSNEIRGDLAHRYSVPLSKHFSSWPSILFRVENRIDVENSALYHKSSFTRNIQVLEKIIEYLPLPSLLCLAKTSRFFHKFLNERVKLSRMSIHSNEGMVHFFNVLGSLHRRDFLPVRVLSLDSTYILNDQQFVTLLHFLPALDQVAIADIKAVNQKNIDLMATRGFLRVDFLPRDQNIQTETIAKLNRMSAYVSDKKIGVFVDWKTTSNRIFPINEKISRISILCTSFICFFALAGIVGVTVSSHNSDSDSIENPLVKPFLITCFAICCLSPLLGLSIPKLIACCLKNRMHYANYQVIEDV